LSFSLRFSFLTMRLRIDICSRFHGAIAAPARYRGATCAVSLGLCGSRMPPLARYLIQFAQGENHAV
jgi:hypothetical protein